VPLAVSAHGFVLSTDGSVLAYGDGG